MIFTLKVNTLLIKVFRFFVAVNEIQTGLVRKESEKLAFDMFAKYRGFDPLYPNNWYNISRQNLLAFKARLLDDSRNIYRTNRFQGMENVLANFKGSVTNALVHAYPHIGLDAKKFKHMTKC